MSYFLRVHAETPTRLWINNPTAEEVGAAMDQGAVACTTNPAFVASLLKRQPDEALPAIDAALAHSTDDELVARHVQRQLAALICERFVGRYESSGGREGLVTIQGAPEADTQAEHIITDARVTRAVAPNATPKIPATLPGLEAMEILVAEGHPLVMTEVFSLAQLAEVAVRYERVASATGQRPVMYVAAITGIFGDRLAVVAQEDGRQLDAQVRAWAGVAFARRAHAEVVAGRYPFTLLFGGARATVDFTGLVGGADHNTINYSTVAEILDLDPPLVTTIDDPVPGHVMASLMDFDEFRVGMQSDGLTVDEFERFGPVQHFRDNFIAGWTVLRTAIAEARLRTRTGVHA